MGTGNAPMLATNHSRLSPTSTGNWRLKASADPARIDNDGTPTNPLTDCASDRNAGGTATARSNGHGNHRSLR